MASLHVQRYEPNHDSIGKLLLLIHGGALSHRFYKDVIPLLNKKGYEILAPDLPGHGQSKALGPFSFEKAVDHLNDTIGKLSKPVVLVGVSLGGQVVLDLLQKHPTCCSSAIVSGSSIHPPDEKVQWEMPHMPDDKTWIEIMTEDVNQMGMENAAGIQQASFAFTFQPPKALPPVLLVVGENDIAMAKRDYDELGQLLKNTNGKSEQLVMQGAWHNHPIDVPEQFATVIDEWLQKVN